MAHRVRVEARGSDGWAVLKGSASSPTTLGRAKTKKEALMIKRAILEAEAKFGEGLEADDAAREAIERAGVRGWIG